MFDIYTIGLNEGSVFSWFLQTYNPNTGAEKAIYYSDSRKNTSLLDHMITYDLGGPLDFWNGEEWIHYENPHLIGWENQGWDPVTQSLGNEDYNDFIFLVDRGIPPVPEPSTLLLFGVGLLSLAGLNRKKQN